MQWRRLYYDTLHIVADAFLRLAKHSHNLWQEDFLMPYKLLMTHRVKPGHYEEVKKWFSDADKSRKSNNPSYERPKRYVTVFGETTEVITEVQMNEVKAGGS